MWIGLTRIHRSKDLFFQKPGFVLPWAQVTKNTNAYFHSYLSI
jgi:hypothetical protein